MNSIKTVALADGTKVPALGQETWYVGGWPAAIYPGSSGYCLGVEISVPSFAEGIDITDMPYFILKQAGHFQTKTAPLIF